MNGETSNITSDINNEAVGFITQRGTSVTMGHKLNTLQINDVNQAYWTVKCAV